MRSLTKAPLVLAALALCVSLALCISASPALAATAVTGGAQAASPTTQTTPSGAQTTPSSRHHAAMASWFGPGFYGNKTACGQTMSPTIVGVANRTLPCGTLVKFAYRGHSLVAPVVDRGPYAKGVEWDLTAGAAQQLGLQETVKVGTRVVGQTANTPTLGVPAGELVAPAPVAGGTAAS
jgi:rare lipoprotein A (peptidoglycan hydrolase)